MKRLLYFTALFSITFVIAAILYVVNTRKDTVSFVGKSSNISDEKENKEIWNVLKNSDWLKMYAIDPSHRPELKFKFNDYFISSHALVTDTKIIYDISDRLKKADDLNDGVAAACFSPRHGFVFEGGWALICFECLQYQSSIGGGLIADSVLEEINDIFRSNGVDPIQSDSKNRFFSK